MPLIDLKHIRFVNKNYWIDYQGNIDFAVMAEFNRMIYFLIDLVNKCETLGNVKNLNSQIKELLKIYSNKI